MSDGCFLLTGKPAVPVSAGPFRFEASFSRSASRGRSFILFATSRSESASEDIPESFDIPYPRYGRYGSDRSPSSGAIRFQHLLRGRRESQTRDSLPLPLLSQLRVQPGRKGESTGRPDPVSRGPRISMVAASQGGRSDEGSPYHGGEGRVPSRGVLFGVVRFRGRPGAAAGQNRGKDRRPIRVADRLFRLRREPEAGRGDKETVRPGTMIP